MPIRRTLCLAPFIAVQTDCIKDCLVSCRRRAESPGESQPLQARVLANASVPALKLVVRTTKTTNVMYAPRMVAGMRLGSMDAGLAAVAA
mmetsp:Transcript_34545/g.91208  ORF Transcript_34545/g.91208 Transcript_34545/m.91208 type:complete len:90 (+) Transcript_34545:62-331(+)